MKKRKLKKPRKYNWKLRDERAKSVVCLDNFPLEIRTKPTAHKQYCLICRHMVEKGDKQIKMPYGMWAKQEYEGKWSGAAAVFGELRSESYIRYYTRYIYLHPDCFGCTINQLMLKAGLPHLQVTNLCETCRNRFNCWTGNMDKEWQESLPAYQPARPCGGDDDSKESPVL